MDVKGDEAYTLHCLCLWERYTVLYCRAKASMLTEERLQLEAKAEVAKAHAQRATNEA